MRDMTRAQFNAALKRRGFVNVGFLGYIEVPLENGSKVSVPRFNAGARYRDQLAYLLKAQDRHNGARP